MRRGACRTASGWAWGDFIFYSVLVGRAAMYDMLTVYAAYLAIVAGLGARTSPWLANQE